MKVTIVHGWEGSPKEPMFQWLRSSLEARDYEASVLAMPNPDLPAIEAWIGKLAQAIVPGDETILVGHSLGCQAVLRYLATLPPDKHVRGIVLIAPWMSLDEETLKDQGPRAREIARPWTETPIDFEKARAAAGKPVVIFSDNDPYVPLAGKELFEKELGAKIVMEKKKGHFTESDGIRALPSALTEILSL